MRETLPYSNMTLSQALEAFRKEHGLDQKYLDMGDDAKKHFERHDIVHVLFGLDTSIRQEAQADSWTVFATDISLKDIAAFSGLPEEKELIKEIGWWAIIKAYVQGIPDSARIAWRARRLRKKWRWSENANYRSARVEDIRSEFGIQRALAG